MPSFHEVRFPTTISRGATGGPERRSEIVVLGSGAEERNARWRDSRRRYNAGYGIRTLDELDAVVAFFEERRGPLYGFRWRDPLDYKSCPPSATPGALDQVLGTGDGTQALFQLRKTYGTAFAPWHRDIVKPVAGTVQVAVAGAPRSIGIHFTVDTTTGLVQFDPGAIPGAGSVVTAGFVFDVPVRFESDRLEFNIQGLTHGAIPSIPIIEIRP
jgi:uncharacterized protein (TIGR02217 family)